MYEHVDVGRTSQRYRYMNGTGRDNRLYIARHVTSHSPVKYQY